MKSDARVRYTKLKIKDTFFQLLEKKDYLLITITELCEKAEINRTTFYKHYLDIHDLLEKLEEEIIEQSQGQWKLLSPSSSIEGMETILTNLQNSKHNIVNYIFKADPSFANKITEIYCQSIKTNYPCVTNCNNQEQNMINRILIYGYGSIIREWLMSQREDKLTAHELAEFLYNMTEKITH